MFFVIRTYSCIFVSYWWLFVSFPCKFVHHSYILRSAVVLSMAFVVVIRENLAVQSYIFLRHSRSNRDRFFLNLIRGLLVRMDTNINSYCIRLCSWCIFVTVWTGHNDERGGVSNHQRLHRLLNGWFMCISKNTLKLCLTGLCAWNSPVTGEFPAKKVSNTENISIWWLHHVISYHSL